ncbi:MAG: peptidoglycan DD-metalloendopeptidase family protein [Acidobacteria bacterium]|nr:peptidoglycan DD-metalloendopeptidase family protein [Acidobacteriota bacterium]
MQSAERFSLGPRLIRLAVPLGLAFLAAALILSTRKLEAHDRGPLALESGPIDRYSPLAVLPSACSARLAAARVAVEYSLARGETLGQVLRRLGMSGDDARQATAALAEHMSVHKIKAGNRYHAFWNPDSTLAAMDLTLAGEGRVEMNRDADGRWRLDWLPFRRSTVLRTIQGTLDGSTSLEAAIERAGGPAGLSGQMAEALQWDLDFARDLRRGDRFEAMYEAFQIDGKDHGAGNLVALVYDNQGRRHEAYRFGGGAVFYDGSGRPLRQMFLRSPLRYTHITSFFSQHRLHPVLNEVKPHNGVDYSAPVGTPVAVTAGGVVVFAGWDGGGGNVVKVQHGPDYLTAYLHLSRFAPGIRPGARVRQGDTIAYTGATGLATGPHLDYRVKYRGDWIDPLTLRGVRDEPIAQAQLASFDSWRDTLRSGLDRGVVPAGLALPWSRSTRSTGSTATQLAGAAAITRAGRFDRGRRDSRGHVRAAATAAAR